MKVLVRLAILVATLLFVTNMTFAAPPCDEEVCYHITLTEESGASHDWTWEACLYDDGTGVLDHSMPLSLFGGSPLWSGFDAHPKWTTWIVYSPTLNGHIWLTEGEFFLNGDVYNIATHSRWIVKGMKIPCTFRTVTVTFNVTVPATTDATGRSVYIAGSLDLLNGSLPAWNPGGVVLTRLDATHWIITLTGDEETSIQYKYTLGDWDHIEKDSSCGEIANRQLTLSYGSNGTQTVNDTVLNWRNVAPCGN